MPSSRLPISHIARLARLELTAEEAAAFETQLDPILEMIDKLHTLNLGGDGDTPVVPAGPPPIREDVPVAGLATSALLANAPAHARDQIVVPRVIDAE